jgi:hypothetical protein
MLAQMHKFVSHVRTNDISPMAHVLESFDPDNSCFLDRTDEEIEPHIADAGDISKWEYEYDREENKKEVE